MSLMVMTQHYDVMSELAKSNHEKVVFVPYTPGGVADMRSQIMQALETNAAEEADTPGKK
jgi:membrane-bound ClpP family serine protease